jgi:hypothetical protein
MLLYSQIMVILLLKGYKFYSVNLAMLTNMMVGTEC